MKDSKFKSIFESGCNIVVGFTINFITNMVILPLFGMPFSLKSFGMIGVFYTGVSLLRSYYIRRLFVNGFYEGIIGRFKK